MQDEELDKIINDAANQHHPAYDDKAWDKMHALLNKHLPQEKDRRRPVAFWWLLVLLIGSGAITTLVMQPWKKNKAANTPVASNQIITTPGNSANKENTKPSVITFENKDENKTAVTQNIEPVTTKEPAASYIPTTPNTSTKKYNTTTANITKEIIQNNKSIFKGKSRTAIKTKAPSVADANSGNEENTTVKKAKGKTKAAIKAGQATEDENKIVEEQPINKDENITTSVKNISNDSVTEKMTAATPKDTIAEKQQLIAATSTPAKKQSNNKGFKNSFAITVSAGADKSYIETSNPGKTKFVYGVGAAYTFAKRFTASTGFFASKKIYDAQPSQYKFPNGTTYPYLWLINADCKVYEIPVNINYSIVQGKKYSVFAGAGISSIIMKEERYNYNYKMPSGQYYNYEHTYSNENKHFFSVITLSAGYRYKVNNYVQLMAEPYMKMPLSGIGAGAIKLKSGGILFTAAIKPFAKK